MNYDEDRLVHIHPRVQGWVEKLHVSAVGDPVKKDQPLYEIYSPELVQRIGARARTGESVPRQTNRDIAAALQMTA